MDEVTAQEFHLARPRQGEVLYRHGVPVGKTGEREPMAHQYPVITICDGCGKTIRRDTAEDPWGHQRWQ